MLESDFARRSIMAVIRRMIWVVAIVAVVGMVVGFSPPSAATPSSRIGANQHYLGYVNGKHANAVIRVACPGPVGGNRTGPPEGKQTVTVKRVSSAGGYTGSFAHEVWAQFGKDALHVVGFTSYNTPMAIPTALRLPCSGTGTVTFTTCFGTLACASSAKADIVHVTVENIAV
jgi:hypothetical protein